jgi:hypothetical protein
MIDGMLSACGFVEQGGLWRDNEDEVAVAVHPLGLFIGWVDVAWPHPSIPVPYLQDVQHIPNSEAQAAQLLEAAQATRSARAKALQTCRSCRGVLTPGRMHDDKTCQRCAETTLGVVY